ncbi:MAG: UDP-N-acetylglucosamine 1-carboxyvinyltransferase [Planctomycetota bacterium]|nr:MAG: UDP-N-acetylglucosamine 1-carboxyvinyltransferase [Planctomycetota bacterium]
MKKLLIEGGNQLNGTIQISGAKNAALPIMANCLLTQEPVILEGIPQLADIKTMCEILNELGATTEWLSENELKICVTKEEKNTASYELVSKMRASICVLGPLLSKRKEAQVSLPGGCVIGTRPIDLHIKGLEKLGASITIENGFVNATADNLKGTKIFLGGQFGSSVLATGNILSAAVLAEGKTTINFAACEPEIEDLAKFLIACGADIEGTGTHRLVIRGVKELKGCRYKIIPDRIETGTFLAAAMATQGSLTLQGANLDHMDAVIETMISAGANISEEDNSIFIESKNGIKAVDFTALAYPGFPTDMQAQMMAVLTIAEGTSIVTEKIFPDRFMHASELSRMGANIKSETGKAIVVGVQKLSGAKVMASDLRASASLIIAGLAAKGTTELNRIYHLDRGYEKIEEKLNNAGARIQRVDA